MTSFTPPPGQHDAQHRMDEAENYGRWLIERSRPYLGRRVLDFGAGLGTLTALIADGREVVAVEPDPWFAEQLRARFVDQANVAVVETDDSGLELAGDDFTAVMSFNVLEHIQDDVAALHHLRERLLPKGYLLLLVPAHMRLFGSIDEQVGHERRYDTRTLGRRLTGAGLEVRELRYVNPVGALGWLISSRVLRRPAVPSQALRLYDSVVPLLRPFDRLRLPFGLSVWAVAQKP